MCIRRAAVLLLLAVSGTTAPAAGADLVDVEPVLPPVAPWDGASRAVAVAADDPWATPFERSGGTDSPSYADTMAWLERLAAAAPELTIVTIGTSDEGRAIRMVVADADGVATPDALHASGRPVVFVHAGIHSGEIDGKDAGMMLLRDMTVRGTRRERLGRASLLFVPILNVDGHERRSPYGRINQRGPANTGWRTNGRDLNINRDFTKLDTPEARAVADVLNRWRPDLYVDVHVTDGADWQYDVTWGANGTHAWSPAIGRWFAETLDPAVTKKLEAAGHVPGPLFFPVEDRDMTRGIVRWTAPPRFTNGWGDARHLPTILVENHSLKPFDRRVFGTYVFLDTVLDVVGREAAGLRAATEADRARRADPVPLSWRVPDGPAADTFALKAVGSRLRPSAISGGLVVDWTGGPVTLTVPSQVMSEPERTARRPRAYWVPASRPQVIERLRAQGIEMERIDAPRDVEVEMLRVVEGTLEAEPFEGRARVENVRTEAETRVERFPAGSVRVPCDQPLGTLAVLMLEPESPDSLFRWGFLLDVLQRTEYAESYVMEPTAARMLEEHPELRAEFERRLLDDPAFAADPRARLDWFYRRTRYYDPRWRLYPVAREVGTAR